MNTIDLKNKLIEANKTYRAGSPIMSDAEFDSLLEQYESYVSPDEYDEFRNSMHEVKGKVKHPFVMGSLDKKKTNEPETILAFIKQYVHGKLNVSAKVDGISSRAHYENGKLVSLSSRGDGYFGESFTDKMTFIKGLPQTIKYTDAIDIRGELVILKDDFANMSGFANPRNACAGIMGRKEFVPTDISNITFVPYSVLGNAFTKAKQFELLESLGFNCAAHKSINVNAETLVNELFDYATQDLPYEIDGCVVSDDDYRNEDEYRPDAQVAIKTNTLVSETTVIDVVFEGPSGYGTHVPVAIVEPVEIGGSTINRASLHNLDIINSLGIKYGSKVELVKSGDIIPKIIKVISNPTNSKDIILPEVCNCCGSTLVRDGVNLCCMNPDCNDKKVNKMTHFIKKLGVKSAAAKMLVKFGIDSFETLLAFTSDKKHKSETKFADELYDKVFTRSEQELFCAIDIKDVGETLLSKIIEFYGWDNVKSFNIDMTKGLPSGIGQITLNKFLNEYKSSVEIVSKITKDVRYHYSSSSINNTLSKTKNGMSICFTGSLNTMGRKEAAAKAEAAGFEVKSGVSRGLTYLCTNDTESGSSKNKKAKEFGTKIINESEFLKMIDGSQNVETSILDM